MSVLHAYRALVKGYDPTAFTVSGVIHTDVPVHILLKLMIKARELCGYEHRDT